MKFGDVKISSAKPSLFLVAAGIIMLLVATALHQRDKEQEMLQRYLDQTLGGLP